MAIEFSDNDYVIISTGKKMLVGKVVALNRVQLTPSKVVEEYEYVDFLPEDVVANVGAKPKIGTVMGVRVEPHLKTFQHDEWGEVDYFYRALPELRRNLDASLTTTHARLKSHGLLGVFPLNTEIRAPSGTYQGMYKYSGNDQSEVPDTVILKPKESGKGLLEFVVAHEIGHGVWFRLLKNKAQAKWVLAYHKAVHLTDVEDKTLARLLNGLLTVNGIYPSGYRKSLDDGDADIYDSIISYIEDYHALDLDDLDALVIGGGDITLLWPDAVKLHDMELILTEYAKKSSKEFFAEAFALFLCGKKLPRELQSLMERTLQSAQR